MKRPLIVFSAIASLLILIWIVGRITGTLQLYNVSSTAMEPTLKLNSRLLVSNLKKPKRNSIIVFSRYTTEKDGLGPAGVRLTFVHRLIAFGGETLQIKRGLAYINGSLVDDTTKLKFDYLIANKDAEKAFQALNIDTDNSQNFNLPPSVDTHSPAFASLSYEDYRKVKKVAVIFKDTTRTTMDVTILYNNKFKKWSPDNYGPITVPDNCYFVLGDNRDHAADSRYIGPVLQKDLIGTALGGK